MLKIEDFYALLTKASGDSLLAMLGELTKIEKVEDVVAAVSNAGLYWEAADLF
jgi:hypothetical protein